MFQSFWILHFRETNWGGNEGGGGKLGRRGKEDEKVKYFYFILVYKLLFNKN